MHRELQRASEKGSALVLTLLFLALFTIVIVAFLSQALLNRQIAFSSAGQERAEAVAQDALVATEDDLRSQMYAGSAVSYDSNNTNLIMVPSAPLAMVPYRLSGATNNLFAWSTNAPLWPGGAPYLAAGPTRSFAGNSTMTPSVNGRYIDPTRWTRPQFVDNFTTQSAPSWVLLTRTGPMNGGAPPLVTLLANPSPTNSSYVVGRYAYAVYDEGACLDVAASGYSSAVASGAGGAGVIARKGIESYADLTQLGISQAQVDTLVNWRNTNSASSASNYTNYVSGYASQSGFMTADTNSGQVFFNRQDLINFWTNSVAVNDPTALQYLTTFSRELNAPSWHPTTDAVTFGGSNDGYNSTNNIDATSPDLPNAYAYKSSADNAGSINRSFPGIRVQSAFTRLDGTHAQVGEPLIKNRFDLTKLAWITHDGTLPSGVSISDVLNYFGLTFNNSTGVYSYDHTGNGDLGLGKRIMTLDEVAQAGREPDFFELLQAGILQGSLGTILGNPGPDTSQNAASMPPNDYNELGTLLSRMNSPFGSPIYRKDSDGKFDYLQEKYQIIQIGANLIDQAGVTGFPTEIVLNNEHFYGIKNLPYFNSLGICILRPTSNPPNPVNKNNITNKNNSGANFIVAAYATYIHSWLTFSLWNPHQNAANPPASSPTKFRVYVANGSVYQYLYGNQSKGEVGLNAPYRNYTFGMTFSPTPQPAPPETAVAQAGPSWLGFDLGDYAGQFAQPTILAMNQCSTAKSWNPAPAEAANINVNDPWGTAETTLYWTRAGIYLGYCYAADEALSQNAPFIKTYIPTAPPPLAPNQYYAHYTGPPPPPSNANSPPFLYSTSWELSLVFPTSLKIQLQYYDPTKGVWRDYEVLNNFAYNNQIYGSPFVEPQDPNGNPIASYKSAVDNDTADEYGNLGPGVGTFYTTTAIPQTEATVLTTPDPRTTRLNLQPSESFSLESNFDPAAASTNLAYPNHYFSYPGLPYFVGALTTKDGMGQYANNLPSPVEAYYKDRDMVARPGDAAGWAGADPQVKVANVPSGPRPVMLNRPFQSVAEIGYAFRDQPWKSLNFFSTNSADTALLDLFCVGSSQQANSPPPSIVAGKVSVNTAPSRVLQSLLAGTGRLAQTNDTAPVTPINSTDAGTLAIMTTNYTSTNAFQSLADLPAIFPQDKSITSENPGNKIQREAYLRALTGSGQTRTWNLLIDVIAQSGRYPTSANANTSLNDFVVEGEKHYWLHVAIDRFNGNILDEKLEPVNE